MSINKPYILTALFVAIVLGLIVWKRCQRENLPSVKPTPAEITRQRITATDTTEIAKYRKLAAERLTQLQALKRDLATAKGKDKQQAAKAHHSANEYAKTPTLNNCDTALSDCQEENSTKAYSLAVQERMLAVYEKGHLADSLEIGRLGSVKDSLNDGWRKSNEYAGTLEKKISKKNNLLKIGGGVIAVLLALVAVK